MDVRRFRTDLYELAARACSGDGQEVRSQVFGIADVLIGLYRKNFVKINHSALELVCARGLVKQGYDFKVEHRLDKALVCGVMDMRGDGILIVEIEIIFIPPEAALEPSLYARGRIAGKIARYSSFTGKFALGTTPAYVLDVPPFFVRPSRERTSEEAVKIKALTDVHYKKLPVTLEELMRARLHSVFVIDFDSATTREIDPKGYLETVSAFMRQGHPDQGLYRNRHSNGRGFIFGEVAA